MYRNRERKEKNNWKMQKKFKKENWWKGKGQVENKSIIFVPATPGSELFKIFKEVEKAERKQNKNLMNFQLIEQTGVSLEKLFQKANPFKEKNCEKNNCPVCDGSGITEKLSASYLTPYYQI